MKTIDIKTPTTKHGVASFITKRWSARSFADKAISDEDLSTLFEAASWAASAMNEQPWHYTYAHKGTPGFEKLLNCLMGGNQPWAKDASVLVMCLAKNNLDRTGASNRHAMHDTGAANTTLLLQAAEMDIYGHMMGGFHMDKTIEAFDVDTEKWEPCCFIALGYLNEAEALEEPFKSRELAPRTRKELHEFTQKLA